MEKFMKEKEFYLYKSDEELYVNKVIYNHKTFIEWINQTSLRLGATTEDVLEKEPEYIHAKLNRIRMERIRRFHCFTLQHDFLGNSKTVWIPGTFRIYHDPVIIKKFLALQCKGGFEIESRDMMGELKVRYYPLYDEFSFYHLYHFLYCIDDLKHPEYLEVVKEYLKQFQFIETQKKVLLEDCENYRQYKWFMFKCNVAKANQKILSLREIN